MAGACVASGPSSAPLFLSAAGLLTWGAWGPITQLLLSLISGRPGGVRGEAGTEQKEAFAEDGDEKVLMPSVNEMLWGSKSRKEKWEHNFTHYHQTVAKLTGP